MVSQNPKCGGDHYINVKQRSISVSCQGMKGRLIVLLSLLVCWVDILLVRLQVSLAMSRQQEQGGHISTDRAMEMWNQIKVSKMFWLVLGSGLLILVLVVTGVILIIGFAPGGRSQVENVMSRSGQQNSSTSWSSPSYKQTSSPVVSSTSFSSLSGWRPTGSETDTHRGNTEILLTTIAPLATTELNFCKTKPCQHGRCVNQNGGYKCTCPTGWTGQNCQHAPCPDDYQKYHDVCYKVFATPKTFSDSSVTCETAGGTLAMPRDAGTNTFLISIMNKNRHADAWIGLHDRKREGRWMWIDGTPSRTGYTAWGPGEPNNQNGKQDCAMYWTANRSLWDDAYCNREEKFICQVKPSDVNVALGKTAFQTSTYKKGVADLAVDGNTDTNYCDGCCTHTLPEKANPCWWVDLGHSYMVDRKFKAHISLKGFIPIMMVFMLRAYFFEVINVADSTSSQCHRYNLEPEVDVLRTRLRAEKYLTELYKVRDVPHISISGKQLTEKLLKF
uniref:C-type lectin domain-containing protein n=1 Tax=Branchiostoma floridae TaxID=7739 RepID=C3Z837_BRAFL|eukprot:XP_002595339.1 hypothetical protein BRAFLDRAFT_87576 [Branchiostoma floridae]